jgi:hypothetical protein
LVNRVDPDHQVGFSHLLFGSFNACRFHHIIRESEAGRVDQVEGPALDRRAHSDGVARGARSIKDDHPVEAE